MGCQCQGIQVLAGTRPRTFYIDPSGVMREVTGLRVQTGGVWPTDLALPGLVAALLGGGLAKLAGASWALAGGIAVGAPILLIGGLALAARSG